jgi:hypothetical protein
LWEVLQLQAKLKLITNDFIANLNISKRRVPHPSRSLRRVGEVEVTFVPAKNKNNNE